MTEILRRPRLVVGISGASGVIYGARLLELLRPIEVETHLVISRAAEPRETHNVKADHAERRHGALGDA